MDEAEPQPYPRDGGHPHWSRALLQTKEHLSIYKTLSFLRQENSPLWYCQHKGKQQAVSKRQVVMGNQEKEAKETYPRLCLIPVFKATVVLVSNKKGIETALQMIQFFNN